MEISMRFNLHSMVHMKLVSINNPVEMMHVMYFNVGKEGQTKRGSKRPENTTYKELQNF